MAFVDMDLVKFYQPPNMAGQCSDGRPATSDFHLSTACTKGNNPRALGLSKRPSGILQGYDWIQVLDMTDPPKDPLNPFDVPAPDLDCIQRDAEGTILRHYL